MQTIQKAALTASKQNSLYQGGPISLSGPSAVGKSTFGKLMAEKMNVPFFDLDDEITKKAGKSTTKEVIQTMGHDYFKQVQHACLKEITENTIGIYILAAGGEIVRPGYNIDIIDKNRQLLRKHTYNIGLLPSDNADEIVQILYPRLNDGKRDTRTKSPEEFRTYVEIAISQYIDFANMVIFTHSAPIEDTLSLLMAGLQTNDKNF
jgi:shikimate kinase